MNLYLHTTESFITYHRYRFVIRRTNRIFVISNNNKTPVPGYHHENAVENGTPTDLDERTLTKIYPYRSVRKIKTLAKRKTDTGTPAGKDVGLINIQSDPIHI